MPLQGTAKISILSPFLLDSMHLMVAASTKDSLWQSSKASSSP
eukprot:09152.XXX_299051_299179_1 [CDS] Oithona nana genome sequencing.